jgi:hypothetical protein
MVASRMLRRLASVYRGCTTHRRPTMGQMKRPGTQDREPRRSKQNGTGAQAKKSRPRSTVAHKISLAHHAASGDTLDTRQNGLKRATGGRKASKA